VDFRFEGHHELRGLEQNPEAASRSAQLAREGKKVMQSLSERRYIAVVVAGTVQFYRGAQPPKVKQDEHENECRNRCATVTLQRRSLAIRRQVGRIELRVG
jgi:hypothetical protein